MMLSSNISIRAIAMEAIRHRKPEGLYWSKEEIASLGAKAEAEINPSMMRSQQDLIEALDSFIRKAEDQRRWFIMNTVEGMRILRREDPWRFDDARKAKMAVKTKIKTAKRHARDHGRSTRFAA